MESRVRLTSPARFGEEGREDRNGQPLYGVPILTLHGLHYRRDVTFHEDATRLTQGQAGHVMAALNNLVIGLLRLAGFTNLAAARRYCSVDLARAVALLSPAPRT